MWVAAADGTRTSGPRVSRAWGNDCARDRVAGSSNGWLRRGGDAGLSNTDLDMTTTGSSNRGQIQGTQRNVRSIV